MLEFDKRNRADEDAIYDQVYAAMETGNHAQARRLLKEYEETFEDTVKTVRASVMVDYGIKL